MNDSRMPRDEASGSVVAILLCTRNGKAYLPQQIESYKRQTYSAWTLYVSDDGSSDGTPACIRACPGLQGQVEIFDGPRRGFSANFLSLACRPGLRADYYAFSDQDDVWHEDKLARAVSWLEKAPPDQPALYCSRTRHIDAAGRFLQLSPVYCERPSFTNALVQNVAGGNTMVFNQRAMDLLRFAGTVDVVAHDWWLYILVTGAGGQVFYDPRPSVDYRQHESNEIGGTTRIQERVGRLMGGRFRDVLDRNEKALGSVADRLTPDSRRAWSEFREARHSPLPRRLIHLYRSGVHRHSWSGSAALWAAAILGKL